MKVLFDSHIFSYQRYGGISRYFVELMKNLPQNIEWEGTTRFTDNVYLKAESGTHGFKWVFTLPINKGKAHIYKRLNHPLDVLALKRGQHDLFHPTYYTPYFLKHVRRPYVITVHDMTVERFPDIFHNGRTTVDKKATVMNAARIIAVSENTKRDLVEIYGISPDKVDVVYHGHSMAVADAQPICSLPSDYVLFTGARGGTKIGIISSNPLHCCTRHTRRLTLFARVHRSKRMRSDRLKSVA